MKKSWLVVLVVISLFLVSCNLEVLNAAEIPEDLPTPPVSPADSQQALAGEGISTGTWDNDIQLYNMLYSNGRTIIYYVNNGRWDYLGYLTAGDQVKRGDITLTIMNRNSPVAGSRIKLESSCANYEIEMGGSGNYAVKRDGVTEDFVVPLNRYNAVSNRVLGSSEDVITVHSASSGVGWFTLRCDEAVVADNLKILGVSSSASPIIPGQPVTVNVRVLNTFSTAKAGVKLRIQLVGQFAASEQTYNLPPGESILSLPIGILPCKGSYDQRATIDYDDIVQERVDNDNEFDFTFTASGSSECYCNNDCDDENQFTTDSCVNSVCQYSQTAIEPRGTINVLVFQVKPDDFLEREEIVCCTAGTCSAVDPALARPDCDRFTVISAFNRQQSTNYAPSAYDIKTWYENKARANGINNFNINLQLVGPYIINNRLAYGFNPDPGVATFFRNMLTQQGYNRNDYDIVHYVYFEDFGINPSTLIQAFRSYADRANGDTFNAFSIPVENTQTIIHEMGHTFNGDDLYGSGFGNCRIPDGIPEPNRQPLFPQSQACLMCGISMVLMI